MLLKAALYIENSHLHTIVVPVKNFPILPLGSVVNIRIPNGGLWWDGGRIKNYTVDPLRGVHISLAALGSRESDVYSGYNKAYLDAQWDMFALICVKDTNNFVHFVYSHELDFGATFPLPKLAAA